MTDPEPTDAPPQAESDAFLGAAPGKILSDGARRALQEAAERRAAIDAAVAAVAAVAEKGGPKGPEPTRYGDWEHKGMAIDFS